MSACDHLNRRAFLARLPVLPVGAASLASATAACSGIPSAQARPTPAGLVTSIEAFGPGNELFLDVPGERFPVYVRRTEEGPYTAVSLRCTHRGCRPDPDSDRLVCPCHGSEFRFDGRVLQGPARTPLDSFAVEVVGNELRLRPNQGGSKW